MISVKPSSFGRLISFVRRYPGGARKRQHLANTVTRYVEMARQFPLPHTITAGKPKLPIKFHGVNLLALPAAAKREKVDNFYAARTANRAALKWPNFAPPFS